MVAIYDLLNPLAADSAFYLELAAELAATSIIDIGCGTGLLTCELAKRGHKWRGGFEPDGATYKVLVRVGRSEAA